MTTATTTAPTLGSFCWWELHTRNTDAARNFYTALLGWKVHNCPPQPGGHSYTEWQVGSDTIGGMMAMPAGVPASVPANWAAYLNVADVDSSVAKVKELGGSVIVPAMDIPGVGRFATIADPTGACLNLFKGVPGTGGGKIQTGQGRFCWIELLTSDTKRAAEFYSKLLGWQVKAGSMPQVDYSVFVLAGFDAADKKGCAAGLMQIPAHWGNFPSCWFTYIWVDDLDASVARVGELGGKVCCPPREIPGVGRFALIDDPTGAGFGLFSSVSAAPPKHSCSCGGCGCG